MTQLRVEHKSEQYTRISSERGHTKGDPLSSNTPAHPTPDAPSTSRGGGGAARAAAVPRPAPQSLHASDGDVPSAIPMPR